MFFTKPTDNNQKVTISTRSFGDQMHIIRKDFKYERCIVHGRHNKEHQKPFRSVAWKCLEKNKYIMCSIYCIILLKNNPQSRVTGTLRFSTGVPVALIFLKIITRPNSFIFILTNNSA